MKITTTSKTGEAASCTPIEIKKTDTTRILFRPSLVKSLKDASKPVKGEFVLQRKLPSDEWDTPKTKAINHADLLTEHKLILDTIQTDAILQTLLTLHAHFVENGLPPYGEEVEVKDDGESLASLIQRIAAKTGVESLLSSLRYIADTDDPKKLVTELQRLDAHSVQKISTIAGLTTLKRSVEAWNAEKENASEKFWQHEFVEMPFLLSQLFSTPIVYMKDTPCVGGQTFDRSGSAYPDILMQSAKTENVVIVELKTPKTPLIGSAYRGEVVYGPSSELSGAIVQAARYKKVLLNEYYGLKAKSPKLTFRAANPHCVVIAGNTSEFKGDDARIESFDLFRNNLRDCSVVTFDELFSKTDALIKILETSPIAVDDEEHW